MNITHAKRLDNSATGTNLVAILDSVNLLPDVVHILQGSFLSQTAKGWEACPESECALLPAKSIGLCLPEHQHEPDAPLPLSI